VCHKSKSKIKIVIATADLPMNVGFKQTIINLVKPMKPTRTSNHNGNYCFEALDLCVSRKIQRHREVVLESIAQGVLLREAAYCLIKLEKAPQHCV
jgi:hypothetical protein